MTSGSRFGLTFSKHLRPRHVKANARSAVRLGSCLVLLGSWKYLVSAVGHAFVGPPVLQPAVRHSVATGLSEARPSISRSLVRAEAVSEDSDSSEGSSSSPFAAAAATAATVGLAASSASGREEQKQSSLTTLAGGIIAALLFCAYVFYSRGQVPATEWLACYVIEYSLSIDNLFVFIIIFKYFRVPDKLQGAVLNYGIIGAILFRFIFVYIGAIVIQEYEFLILGFAGILIYASYQGFTKADDDDDDDDDLENNWIVTNLRKVLDVSPTFDGDKFFTQVDGKSMITPLLLCLLTIEFSDIVFATDSVPAVLGTTKDQFIAYTSNLFAVFGLRSLYFILQEAMVSFVYLESAVNVVLGFIGVKIVLDYFEVVQIDVVLSLAIVLGTLASGVLMSMKEMNDGKESHDNED
ncbi:unnamed protein product [Polarella glacialis]|uniref:Tellurium resistance protein TerC n=1 Tax=Polarella glacialis TaxID=89957 RepID=A0A813LBF1_POLGL|nr:unnamed protein product [Polarella glacialis]